MFKFLNEFWKGIFSYQKAFRFCSEHQLWRFFWLPFLLSLLLYVGMAVLVWFLGSYLVNELEQILSPYLVTEQKWLVWLTWFSKLLLKVLILILYYKFYRYLMLILMSPALAFLAEKVQNILQNKDFDGNLGQVVHDFLRGLKLSLSNLFYELSIGIVLMLLSLFIPVLSVVFAIGIFLNEAYFVGFSMIDYRNELLRISAKDSQKMAFRHVGFCIGNGIVCNVLMLVPFLGVGLPLLSVVAAGIGIEELEKNQSNLPKI